MSILTAIPKRHPDIAWRAVEDEGLLVDPHTNQVYPLNQIALRVWQESEWKNALDQMAELGILYLTMSGGEIFLRKDFWEIAYHAKKNNFALQLFTNGTLIDEAKADRLADLRPYRVEMSLLSPVETMHDL